MPHSNKSYEKQKLKDNLTYEEIKSLENKFKNVKGRKYPCSNQNVICGFFADTNKWEKFIALNFSSINLFKGKDCIRLNNGEIWKRFEPNYYNARGNRFYKLYIDKNVSSKLFFSNIYPYITFYCSKLKFI